MSEAPGNTAEPAQQHTSTVLHKPVAAAGKRPGVSVLLLLLTLLFLAGLTVLGVLLWRQETALSSLVTEFSTLDQQRLAMETRLAASETARTQAQQTLSDSFTTLQAQQKTQLDTLQRELAVLRLQSADGNGSAFLLSETAALLRLARERLLGARDVATAISLYLEADELLGAQTDPRVLAVRQILRAELETLQAIQVPDLAVLHQQLGVLRTQVNGLPLSSTLTGTDLKIPAPTVDENSAPTGWLDAIGKTISKHFVLTQRTATVLPQLSAEGAALIRQALALQLEKARLALLLGDARLYQAALNEAIAGISSNLDGSDKARIITALQQLRDTNIAVTVPPTGSTLNALRALSSGATTLQEQP